MALVPHPRTVPARPKSDRPASPGEARGGTRRVATSKGEVELRRTPQGALEVYPRPSAERLREYYADDFYQRTHASFLQDKERDRSYWTAIWDLRRSMIEHALGTTPRRRLLDVGCGGGFLLDHFRRHGWQTVGIEPSRAACEWARRRLGLDVFCGELLDDPQPEAGRDASTPGITQGSFDAVYCAQVLEHVLDPAASIERMASLLRSGGVAYVEVPNDFNALQETARERLGHDAWWVVPQDHLNYFSFESLSALLAEHGLEEVDRIGSFPMEMFLLMGRDYVGAPDIGAACHRERMAFERALIETGRSERLLALYRGLASAGLGRTCGIVARKR